MQAIYSFKVDEEQTIVLIHCIPEGHDGGKETYQYILLQKICPFFRGMLNLWQTSFIGCWNNVSEMDTNWNNE